MSDISFEEQVEWRDKFIIDSGWGDDNSDISVFSPPDYYNKKKKKYKTQREVMDFDLYNLRKSDIVVVNFNVPKSIGTAMELILAKELHIPIIGINEDKKKLHPWLVECVSRMCDSIGEAIEYIHGFYLSW